VPLGQGGLGFDAAIGACSVAVAHATRDMDGIYEEKEEGGEGGGGGV
jgi:hypothetical protein